MEVLKNEADRLQPVYMSQDEATEVMALWADLQKADSARQSMLTVHDVAEAIQLPPDQVAQFLKQVRQKQNLSPQSFAQSQPRVQSIPRDISDATLIRTVYFSVWSFAMVFLGAMGANNSVAGAWLIASLVGIFALSSLTLTYRYFTRRIVKKHLSQQDPFHGN